jgi:hypothetical protein
MSDGEKVVLFLIAQVLQAPPSGFVIVDEPEMYLHKTILNKLWDRLEKERKDCIFIYLTHDLDFAIRRTTAKKVWIRSFTFPETWEIETIPENEIPDNLLLELLGSRKDILFCEGKKGSIDEKIYNILFSEFTITPVESCFDVINFTKAFNKIPMTTVKALGLIDADHHSRARLSKLEIEGIYSLEVAEAENIFFDDKFLALMAKQLLMDTSIVDSIKTDSLTQLKLDINLQIANYLSTRVNYYFKDSDVSKGNTLDQLKAHFNAFCAEIKLDDWYLERKTELEAILASNDYAKLISVFNNKGLKAIANKRLRISDFIDRAIKLLEYEPQAQEIILGYFPQQLTSRQKAKLDGLHA